MPHLFLCLQALANRIEARYLSMGKVSAGCGLPT